MENTSATIVFLDAIEHSFLTAKEKKTLREAARDGITQELWNELNDRLIASIVQTRQMQKRFTGDLDDEINRFTAAYEREKSLIDQSLRAKLQNTDPRDSGAREKLWEDYGKTIRELQGRLLNEVKEKSTTVLHDVVMATVPMQGNE